MEKIYKIKRYDIFTTFYQIFCLTLRDRVLFRTLINLIVGPPLSLFPLKIKTYTFSGCLCAFREKNTFSSHGGKTAPWRLFSGKLLNVKTTLK